MDLRVKLVSVASLVLIGWTFASSLAFANSQERPAAQAVTDYVVGPQDVLTITSYDQADLSGRFTLEADGTFTYPLIGRVRAGGLTLRGVESAIKKQLVD